jgi:RNA methyltransferase, TrmH family
VVVGLGDFLMNIISSVSNSKIKQIVKLTNSRNTRYEQSLAVIYGRHLVEEALNHKILHSVFINQHKLDDYSEIIPKINTQNIYLVNGEVLAKISISDTVADIIGLIQITSGVISDNIYTTDCVILDNIQDPGNLGTIMRSCTACGINNMLLSKSCVDPYNLKVLRASQGLQFRLNIITAVDIIQFICNYKYSVIATMPGVKNSIYEYDLTKPAAWLFGNEGAGISDGLLDHISHQLAIPMQGNTESLNVAMAATVCLFEMIRQRLY